MNDDSVIVSRFDSEAGGVAPFVVDFDSAKQLDGGGSTCDIYECTIQRRHVFVKRLKAEYRDNPLYRAAFSKEYDLGVTLSHSSLPRYVGFGKDYLVLDFVEGDTLADLMKRGDRRLSDKRFVRKLLNELVDVVEYLHNRNIVHCDIKADNIIISPHPDRPATLIDFDKAYSPWLDSTHGDAAKYGCEGCADGAVDFKAIGLLAARLGMKRLACACNRPDVTAGALRKTATGQPGWWIMTALSALIVTALTTTVIWYKSTGTTPPEYSAPDSTITVEISPETAPAPLPEAPSKPTIDQARISALITEHEAEINDYRQALWAILDCDTIPISDKRTAIMDYSYHSGRAISQIIVSAVSCYSNLPELDVQNEVRSNPEWIRLNDEEMDLHNRLMYWRPKESQRPSGRPALLPDTIQGGTLHAQHH